MQTFCVRGIANRACVSPLTKSTSIRSGLTCPVFFGLFLKPCGRERQREEQAASELLAARERTLLTFTRGSVPFRVRIVGPPFRVRTDGWSRGVVGRVIKSHTVYRWRRGGEGRGDRDACAHNRPCSRLGSGLRRCLTSLHFASCSIVADGGSGSSRPVA